MTGEQQSLFSSYQFQSKSFYGRVVIEAVFVPHRLLTHRMVDITKFIELSSWCDGEKRIVVKLYFLLAFSLKITRISVKYWSMVSQSQPYRSDDWHTGTAIGWRLVSITGYFVCMWLFFASSWVYLSLFRWKLYHLLLGIYTFCSWHRTLATITHWLLVTSVVFSVQALC